MKNNKDKKRKFLSREEKFAAVSVLVMYLIILYISSKEENTDINWISAISVISLIVLFVVAMCAIVNYALSKAKELTEKRK